MSEFKKITTVGVKGRVCEKYDANSDPVPGYLFIVFWDDKQIGVATTFEEAEKIVYAHRLKLKAERDHSNRPSLKM
ncbi:hypothetical protein [Marinobacter sp.]|uniref:hypothetical protein n=1 Tax=Marinobacter sp. TaxID=50741 RepID=UPI003A8F9176|tara:strand:+ start:904 stop:1131 length:228 start_codon:yes stop_codon:yes gene_type:complete